MTTTVPALLAAAELDELRAVAQGASLRILDTTTFLHTTVEAAGYTATTGEEGYLEEHVPGALFADVPGVLSDPTADELFALPTDAQIKAAAEGLGIGDDTHVVVYDNVGNAWATRVWWLLRYFGHDKVSVLDGGLGAWKAAGLPVASGTDDAQSLATAPAVTFTPSRRPHLLATRDEIVATLPGSGNEGTVVVNALDPATFAGTPELNPYPRRGRIPGSVNLPLFTLLDPATGRFLPEEQLVEKLQEQGVLDADRAVTYCGGGIAATLPAFAAFHAAGVEVAVYDGSLTEWTGDPSLPVEVG